MGVVELVADQKLDPEDYRELKLDCANKITVLEAKLAGSSQAERNIDGLLDQAVSNLCRLDTLYQEGTVAQKRQIIGSIYPEKLVFDGFQYRTKRVNEAINLMCLIDKQLRAKKNGTSLNILNLSQEVTPQGLEPWTH